MSFLNDYASGNINFAAGAVSTPQMTILPSGNVGIGTTNPSAALEVNGNIKTTDNRSLPNLVLDSISSGDNWSDQGAYISLGESGALGSAAMHITYTGDGYGYTGAGTVTNGIPAGGYWRYHYNTQNIYSPSTVTAPTFVGALTGNASTATTLIGDQTNWASYRSSAVANMLSWKNYGNGHVIFDASNSTSPTGSAVNNTNPTTAWSATYPTLMGWNGTQTYGVRVDSSRNADDANLLDSINSTSFLRSDIDDNLTAAIIVPTANRDEGIFGTYDSAKTQHIWSMGTSYRNAADGSNFGNLYGLAYKYNSSAGGHGVYLVNNGSALSGLGTNLWTSGRAYIGDGTEALPSHSFDSDKNTGMYSDAADFIKFSTGGSMRMTINSDGVGIGRLGSWGKLHTYMSSTQQGIVSDGTVGQYYTMYHAMARGATETADRYLFVGSRVDSSGNTVDTEFRLQMNGAAYTDGGWNGAADYAEYFETNDTTIDKAELISIDPINHNLVKRASASDRPQLLGVISTKPGFVGARGDDTTDTFDAIENNPRFKIVGLMGQVPTYVTTENGPINPGDPITISSVPGVGTKATSAGFIVGRAQEAYSDTTKPGKIWVYVQATWFDPNIAFDTQGNITLLSQRIDALETTTATLSANQQSLATDVATLSTSNNTLTQLVANLTSNFALLSSQVASLFTRQSTVETQVAQITDTTDLLSTSMTDLEATVATLSASLPNTATEDRISSLVSPISDDVATLSARLSYLETRITGQAAPEPIPVATIAGTTDDSATEAITSVESRMSQLESTIASLSSSFLLPSSESTDLSLDLTASQSALLDSLLASSAATPSSSFLLPTSDLNLDVESVFVSDFLSVLGDSVLTNLTVTNNLTTASIGSLDGHLDLMAGLITLDATGSLVTINGDLVVTGNVSAQSSNFQLLASDTASISGTLSAPVIDELSAENAALAARLASLEILYASLSAQISTPSAEATASSTTTEPLTTNNQPPTTDSTSTRLDILTNQ
jgi:hypothetical protein